MNIPYKKIMIASIVISSMCFLLAFLIDDSLFRISIVALATIVWMICLVSDLLLLIKNSKQEYIDICRGIIAKDIDETIIEIEKNKRST